MTGLLLGLLEVPGVAQPTDEIEFQESVETATEYALRDIELTDARMLAPFDLYWGVQ